MTAQSRHSQDQQRFAQWGHQHGQAVRGYLLAMVGRVDVAEDLTQEVFARAWQARRRYREQGYARAYLLRIADRLVFDRQRKAGREVTLDEENWKRIEPPARTEDPSQTLARTEAAKELTAALEQISPAQRRVLLLRYYGQLSFSEIARIMECPISTALSHGRRGLLTLRKLLVENMP
ncbi:MAG: RNA polymerase sigma factor [Candidatus Nealsonbacteria bacterium]|nr:RNA polymerase sigma factor [Candidatus Nealsonbacteria bacterium]